MGYEGTVYAVALAEYDAILEYIRGRSGQGAQRVQHRIDSLIRNLERFPHIGTLDNRRAAGVRILVATPYPYLVFYEIVRAAREVINLHIRHGARDRDV